MTAESRAKRTTIAVAAGLAVVLVAATSIATLAAGSPNPGPFTGCLMPNVGLVYHVAPGSSPTKACRRQDELISFGGSESAEAFPEVYSVLEVQLVDTPKAQIRAYCDAGDQVISGGYHTVYRDIVTTSLPVIGTPSGWEVWIDKTGSSAASESTIVFQVKALCADTAD